MKFTIFKLRIVLWSILVLIVAWLSYMAVVPSGRITYAQDFKGDNFFIQKLTPAERVEDAKNGSQKISGDPAYFSLRTPRRFDTAKVEIKYKNKSDWPIVETGVLVDKILWRYDTKPIENRIIDQLAMVWDVVKKDNATLLQKQKKYNSIDEFLDNLPPRTEMALYDYDLQKEYLLADYKPSKKDIEIIYALRGAYQFYTYIKDEKLNFNFILIDLNANKDSDPVDVNLYYQNGLIASKHLDDDGVVGEKNKASAERALSFTADNLPEGVYKLEIKTNDDIVTKKIKTSQNKLAFINSVRLANENKENIIIYTDSSQVNVQTINPAKLQTVYIDGQKLELKETYKQFDLVSVSSTTKKIKLAKDDIMLSGDSSFSFAADELINPNFKKISAKTSINEQGINYILTGYQSPQQDGEWKKNNAVIDLSNAYREFNKYSFIIAIPGLKADDNIDDNIEIGEIKIELQGTSLWGKIKKMIKI